MWDILILIGWVLAVARVTRLIAMDRITEDVRIAIVRHFGEGHMISYLVNCMWCVSIWVAAASTPVAVLMAHRSWPEAGLLALAASYITGMLSRLDADDEVEIEITE
jgi:hypothetical protein